MVKAFLDTNIFFYAADGRDSNKQEKARQLVAELAKSGEGVVSTQVVQEFAFNAMKKLGFTVDQTRTLCEGFSDHSIVRLDFDLIQNSLRLMSESSVSFWDACIVSAAAHAKCKVLYTEDMNSGQVIAGVRIANPFL